MKKFKSTETRILACLTAALLLVQLAAPLAAAVEGGKTIHIGSPEDWAQLAENCRLDAWSDGVTVILDNDLELPEDCQIPTFGGTLEGQGHTLSHLLLTGAGDHQGLFRYLRAGAVIQDLTVIGTVAPEGSSSVIGGLAGSNSGTIRNCRFLGAVSGTSTVGGLAGVNELTGRMEDCSFDSGAVSGEHFTGGIAGENYGTVLRCQNQGQINTQAMDPVPQLEDVDLSHLNQTENLPACTDTGGIAGYSGGLLQDCTNLGSVGYPHLGYNVGGIAGRQGGQMLGCVNEGSVRGRKDVGGIVGQAEPFMELRYREDTLQKLANQLDGLSHALQSATDGMDGTRQELSGHLTTLSGQTGDAQTHISALLDELELLGDETVDVTNDLSSRIRMFMDDLPDAVQELEDASQQLSQGLSELESALKEAGTLPDHVEDAAHGLEDALSTLDEALRTLLTGVPVPLSPSMSLEEILHALELLKAVIDQIPAADEKAAQALEQLGDALDALEHANGSVESAFREMEDAMDALSDGSDHLTASFRQLREAVERQNELPELELPKLSPDFHEAEDALRQTLTALNDELEQVNQTLNLGGDTLSGHLSQVNRQFRAVTDVLRHAGDEKNPELVVDLSEETLNETAGGRLQDCRNAGAVEGDVNVGGVAGAMAIEFDFDPEDDVQEKGSHSLNFQYLTKAVTSHCSNQGPVTARKDCVGGLVGRMDLGIVWGGQNYGSVESTGGQEVGGIAGHSDSVIRDCWVKCALSGSSHVGGIAGLGTDLRDCRTLVAIEDAGPYSGAIAGETTGLLADNVFLSESLGGVDGISYQGKAAPLSREAFLTLPGLPAEFSRLWVRFTANGRLVKSLSVSYGESLSPEDIPNVPEKDGHYGVWELAEEAPICFDMEIPAVYTPWLSAAASKDGALLAEGLFPPETVLEVQSSSDAAPAGEVLAQYAISLSADPQEVSALRIKLPEDVRRAKLWIKTADRAWQEAEATLEGSYLRAAWDGTDVDICLTKAGPGAAVMGLALGGAGLAAAVILLLLRKKRTAAK